MKRKCCDCGHKSDGFRPVVRLASGKVLWACRQCWYAFEYVVFIGGAMSPI